MLKTNLATRPFYNERPIHLLLVMAAATVLVVTLLNVSRIVTLSRHSTELSAGTSAARSEAVRLSTEATRIRRTINKDELALIVGAAEEANALIDQRTFSWTEFFNQIEATIPPDVMLTSVRPSFKDGVTSVSMIVLAKKPADVDEFVEKLEATGAFENVLAANSELTDDGLQRATIHSEYVGNPVEPETSPAGATSEAPAARPAGEKESRPGPAPPTAPARGEKTPPATATPKAGQPPRGGGRQ
jgi:type IV pilus assembly protein PilN